MKKFLIIIILLGVNGIISAQVYDLIVKKNGDSLACFIDSITDAQLFFEMRRLDQLIHTRLEKSNVKEYKENVLHAEYVVFKQGSSVIKHVRTPTEICKNFLYIELLGNGNSWSANYERFFPRQKKLHFTIRAGFSQSDGYTVIEKLGIIGETNALLFGPKHFFENGIGFVYFPEHASDSYPTLKTGYRFHGKNGLMLRLGIAYIEGNSFWPGISIGFSFF